MINKINTKIRKQKFDMIKYTIKKLKMRIGCWHPDWGIVLKNESIKDTGSLLT